ncbi:MAG TPA: amino acid adenylation domain-containing protein [Ktedonosporobacter sp.]|jgi:amino acid adenylation domain-containing protein|nr:amino acid adenylation domain-containing protein [Ktedonosporobacter sp.]
MIVLLTYNTDLFQKETMQRLLNHFQHLLEGVTAYLDRPLLDLPILSPVERRSLLFHWNTTEELLPEQREPHEIIESQAQFTPDAIAVVDQWRQYTYQELNRRANQLAHYLQQLGVGPEVRVGLYLPRTFELILAVLAVLKAGGVYVPLDPDYPRKRVCFILEDAEVAVLLTRQSFLPSFPAEIGCSVCCLDTDWALVEEYPTSPPPHQAHAMNLAYILYTSGSTGVPKGVGVSQQSLTTLLSWVRATYSAAELAGVLASTSICFDISLFEIFAPLCVGGKIILVDSILQLATIPQTGLVTLVNTVPSGLAGVLLQGDLLPCIQTINLAGEVLPVRLVQQIRRQSAIQRICNLYGPTEATVYATMTVIGEKNAIACPIGRPITNTQVYILDSNLEPVPIGVAGEIYLGGTGLARGYIQRPELTAEYFLPHPHSSQPGARLYRTGDRAHYLPDGSIQYLGRRDRQIKLRGYRIELGEIEAALLDYPGVIADAVKVEASDEIHTRLVAYLAMEKQKEVPSIDQLRRFLSTRLPGYILLTHAVFLNELPRKENGKLDYEALPPSYSAEMAKNYVAPRNVLEAQLQSIWAALLGQQRVSVMQSFFDLGGHSILAVALAVTIERQLGLKCKVADIYCYATIANLADFLSCQKEK